MKTTSKSNWFYALSFTLSLLTSSSFGGTVESDISSYQSGESYSTIEEDGNFCGNGNQCGGPTVATVNRVKRCNDPLICPSWFRRYIINPIRGAIRTGWD
ncbi:hypothetical protein BN59_01673 [Legionella massiliensis]|uniref:Secreted protein n=1 Tax=Legionella massiliensis TaxID=1034943 RepID=A0A078KSG4_9GAMM|nr:hypothetical protein [Legionella massiliensis]CDZ77390.1 hypothetical protein BN59_01673 [Legionella massiliensis]CEE13128.1 hypothetical protein BN1094_01673 [Legionella massiliensis]